jgi:hypothetical protein
MNPRRWTSVVFFLSSYAPLAPIIIFKDYDRRYHRIAHPIGVAIVAAIAVISVILLFLAMRSIREGVVVDVRSVSNKSGELVNYTIPYMISFFGFDLGDGNAVFAFVFFLLLMYVLTVRTQNVFINPMLALRGWSLYDVTFADGKIDRQGTFLTREELRPGHSATIQRVARFFYIVTSTNPEV